MSKRILILGAGEMQGVSIRIARSRGWKTVVIDGNPDALCRSLADHFEPIDLKNIPAIVEFALDLQKNGGLDGVFTAATDFSVSVAAAAAACGLPGHRLDAAKNASDKLRMRSCFADAGVPSPRCIGVTRPDLSTITETLAAARIPFPVVVKPVDSMGARGCIRVNDPSTLEAACVDALRYSRSGKGIVEEYMRGINDALEEFGTVEMTVYRDTNWDTETALNATQDVLAAGEEFDVIFANNESMAVGCYNALEDAGLAGNIPIVSTGGGPTGVQMLKDGIIQATIAGPVSLQGLYLFKAMYLYETQGILPPEKHIAPGVTAITLDNLDETISWIPSDELIEMIGGLDNW